MTYELPVTESGGEKFASATDHNTAINAELAAVKAAVVAAASDPAVADAMIDEVEALVTGAVSSTAADRVAVAADRAATETARDASFATATVYADIATGRAAVADGAQFTVVASGASEAVRYRRDTSSTQTELVRYPTSVPVNDIIDRLPGPFRVSPLAPESGYVWGVVDADDRIALGVTPAGQVFLTPIEGTPGTLPLEVENTNIVNDSGWLHAWTDSAARVGYGLRPDGTFWARLADDCPIPAWAASLPSNTITFWGDSMTAGSGGGGTTISSVVASLLGRTVNNRGIGGQNSAAIATRQGALPMLVTVTGDQIPASGPVTLTARSQTPITNQGASSFTGTLAGVAGTLAASTSDGGATYTYTFTRTTAGSAVACPANSQFVFDFAVADRDDTVVIWSGRNDGRNTRAEQIAIRNNILAMHSYLSPQIKRSLVLPIFNGRAVSTGGGAYEPSGSAGYNNIIATNQELARTLGPAFLADARDYMVRFAIYDAGLTPTADDLSDIAADCVPRQLMSDNVHGTAAFYTQLGGYIARQITARGW